MTTWYGGYTSVSYIVSNVPSTFQRHLLILGVGCLILMQWSAAAEPRSTVPPVVQRTLARFIPDARAVYTVAMISVGSQAAYHFLLDGEAGPYEITVLSDGTLLSLAQEISPETVPASIRALFDERIQASSPSIQHLWLMAYEIETEGPGDGETERFVNPLGEALFEGFKPGEGDPEQEDEAVRESLEDLSALARQTLIRHLAGADPVRIEAEVEWGVRVHAVKWVGPEGGQEIKVLEDGRTLFLELPKTEPIPPPVRVLLEAGGEVEALLLEGYRLRAGSDCGDEPITILSISVP